MIHLILFIILCYAGFLLYFQLLQRPLFILYNRKETDAAISLRDFMAMSRHGLRSDVIVASYLTALPVIAATVQAYVSTPFLGIFMAVYSIVAGLTVAVGTVVDTALYPFWKFKLDACVLPYVKQMKSAFASVSTRYIIAGAIALLAMSGITVGWFWLTSRVAMGSGPFIASGVLQMALTPLIFILAVGCLFMLIRGLGRRPNLSLIHI